MVLGDVDERLGLSVWCAISAYRASFGADKRRWRFWGNTGAPLQIIDLPGIIEGAKDGRGRGRQVIAVAKTCHLIFIVLDVNKPLTDKRVIESELEGFGIRINKSPPNITFKKKEKGGLNITSTVPLTHIDHDEIKAVMSEYRINSADIAIRCDATIDDLIDILEAKSRSYIPVIYVLNKIDAISIEELDLLYRIPNAVPISSEHGWNIDELMEAMLVTITRGKDVACRDKRRGLHGLFFGLDLVMN